MKTNWHFLHLSISRFKKLKFISYFCTVLWLQNIFTPPSLAFSSHKLHNFLVESCNNAVADSPTAASILRVQNIFKVPKICSLKTAFNYCWHPISLLYKTQKCHSPLQPTLPPLPPPVLLYSIKGHLLELQQQKTAHKTIFHFQILE